MSTQWKRKLVDAVRRCCRGFPVENLLRGSLSLATKLNPALFEREDSDYETRFQCVHLNELAEVLDALPTETTKAERRFLYFYFSRLWSGHDSVLEVGPFLGGTTRAIALGMLENANRQQQSRLKTYDRFKNYYTPENLSRILHPLVERGVLTPDDLVTLGNDASFLDIFRHLHGHHKYFQLIDVECESLPTTLHEATRPGSWMRFDAEYKFSAVFVDGCKSWYATKYFLQQLAPMTYENTTFLFQDYGSYTCFWISAVVYLLEEYFEPQMYVDTTFVYKLKKPLTVAALHEHIPDEPSQIGANRFREIFSTLSRAAERRHDSRTQVIHQLHLAAALAYLGDLDAARSTVQWASQLPGATHVRRQIDRARHSPTYWPSGEQIRL